MIKLIKKDLILTYFSKGAITLILFFIPFVMFLIDFQIKERIIAVVIFTITYVLAIGPFEHEEKSRPHMLIQSLPIKKNEIIISKYIGMFVNYILALVYTGIGLWIIKFLGNSSVDSLNLSIIKITLPIVIIFHSIILPILIRLSTKVASAIGMGIFVFINNTYLIYDYEKTCMRLLETSKPLLVPIMVIIILFISIGLSIALYENRDLT